MFNIHYSKSTNLAKTILMIFKRIIKQPIWIVLPVCANYIYKGEKHQQIIRILLINILLDFFCLLSGSFFYMHYLLTLIPYWILLFGMVFNKIFIFPRNIYKYCLVIIIAINYTINPIHSKISSAFYFKNHIFVKDMKIVEKLEKYNYNLLVISGGPDSCLWYRYYDAKPVGKYIYLPPVELPIKMKNDFLHIIKSQKVSLILVPNERKCFPDDYIKQLDKYYKRMIVRDGMLYEKK